MVRRMIDLDELVAFVRDRNDEDREEIRPRYFQTHWPGSFQKYRSRSQIVARHSGDWVLAHADVVDAHLALIARWNEATGKMPVPLVVEDAARTLATPWSVRDDDTQHPQWRDRWTAVSGEPRGVWLTPGQQQVWPANTVIHLCLLCGARYLPGPVVGALKPSRAGGKILLGELLQTVEEFHASAPRNSLLARARDAEEALAEHARDVHGAHNAEEFAALIEAGAVNRRVPSTPEGKRRTGVMTNDAQTASNYRRALINFVDARMREVGYRLELDVPPGQADDEGMPGTARLLASWEAADKLRSDNPGAAGFADGLEYALRTQAALFRDHSNYDENWRPGEPPNWAGGRRH